MTDTSTLTISDDHARLDRDLIYDFLSRVSYWARGIPREIVERAIDNSHCFGAYSDGKQIAFARVITDHATFGYLSDVFVIAEHRGRGVAKHLVQSILDHPDFAMLRRWMLVTQDAQELYRKLGFENPPNPEWVMQIRRRNLYDVEAGPTA